jgi:hypothetical protein
VKTPKFTDGRRYTRPYVPVADQGEGYLQRRFQEIRDQQRADAEERLRKTIQIRRKG